MKKQEHNPGWSQPFRPSDCMTKKYVITNTSGFSPQQGGFNTQ